MAERRLTLPVFAETDDPLTVRLEPWGVAREVQPRGALYVLASGPVEGMLEIERTGMELVVYGWNGSQIAFEAVPAPCRDLDELLARVSGASVAWTPSQRSTFAACVASRHERDLGDDADTRAAPGRPTPREIIEELWTAAAARPIASVDAHLATIEQVYALVDPDRLSASAVRGALAVLDAALRTANGARGALELADAALAVRALTTPGNAGARAAIGARWTWDGVQGEARWLAIVAAALSTTDPMDRIAVEILRAACRPARAVVAAPVLPAAPAAPRVRPRRALAPATPARPAPPASAAPAASSEIAPRVVELMVGGHPVSLVGVDENRAFRVEVGGTRRVVRWRLTQHWRTSDMTPPPPWKQGTEAEIGPLLACLDGGAERTEDARGTTFTLHVAGAHFRQNEWTTVVVVVAADGAVEIDMTITIQDESYY